jgi:mannose-6-phosphate isomerase
MGEGLIHAQGPATFPLLLKVLAAAAPLSIQVHPDADQARAGFARETAAGIPLDAAQRTYRDPFPKPELICALTPFSAKCGLRPIRATLEVLAALDTPVLDGLVRVLDVQTVSEPDRLRRAIRWLFDCNPEVATAVVDAVATAAAKVPDDHPHTGELRWTVQLAQAHPGDIGVAVALLLNHVELAPGQALFLGAGNMHCYLQGVAVEVMAPSDNVVRGGLTGKHIDIDELLVLLDPRPVVPVVQQHTASVHAYDIPDSGFGLTRIDLAAAKSPVELIGPGILLVVEGEGTATGVDTAIPVARGQALLITAADGDVALSGSGVAFWSHA